MKITTKNILALSLLFCSTILIAQVSISGNIKLEPEKYKAIKIEEKSKNIYYKYSFVKDLENKSKVKTSLTVLQIGTNFSKFTDILIIKKDSLEEKFSHLESIGNKEINQLLAKKSKIGFNKNVIQDLKNKIITVQSEIYSDKYEYNTISPSLNWKLEKNQKSILDYKVRKATVHYSGRNWIAWYTEDIPINIGPYVFGNLPGLILELYDDKQNFHFIAVGINDKKQKIYKRDDRNIMKISKKDFLKAEKNFHERPELYLRGTIRGDSNIKSLPYNPIEIIKF